MSTIYKNLFNLKEINILLKYFENKPYGDIQVVNDILWCKNKDLDYHVPNTLIYKIVRTKINSIIGKHEISLGSYKESYWPYGTHIDGYATHETNYKIKSTINHNIAILIPLTEHEKFNTITFNCFDEEFEGMNKPLKSEWLTSANNLSLEDLDHIPGNVRNSIPYLPVDTAFNWELGSALTWRRDQLHTSTNFAKYGLVKKFIILFIA